MHSHISILFDGIIITLENATIVSSNYSIPNKKIQLRKMTRRKVSGSSWKISLVVVYPAIGELIVPINGITCGYSGFSDQVCSRNDVTTRSVVTIVVKCAQNPWLYLLCSSLKALGCWMQASEIIDCRK
jgi:hypothetical protein